MFGQQKLNSYAAAASLQCRWHLCSFLWTYLQEEMKEKYLHLITYCYSFTGALLPPSVKRTIFHSRIKSGLIQIHHAMDAAERNSMLLQLSILDGIPS